MNIFTIFDQAVVALMFKKVLQRDLNAPHPSAVMQIETCWKTVTCLVTLSDEFDDKVV